MGSLQSLAQDAPHVVHFLQRLPCERRRDRVDGEATGEVAGGMPAQPVRDSENALLLVDEEGILVSSPHEADLGPGSHLHQILFSQPVAWKVTVQANDGEHQAVQMSTWPRPCHRKLL